MLNIFLNASLGLYLTYTLRYFLALNPVVASALVGLTCHYLSLKIKKVNSPVCYMASFVAMTKMELMNNASFSLLAPLVATFIFYSLKEKLNGFGGKLGTIAFISAGILTLFNGVLHG